MENYLNKNTRKKTSVAAILNFIVFSITLTLFVISTFVSFFNMLDKTGDAAVFAAMLFATILTLLPLIVYTISKKYVNEFILIVYYVCLIIVFYVGTMLNVYKSFEYFDIITQIVISMFFSIMSLFLLNGAFRNNNFKHCFTSVVVCVLLATVAFGAMIEMIEFAIDILFDLNLQNYEVLKNLAYTGQNALNDTLVDMFILTATAIASSFTLAAVLVKKPNFLNYFKIKTKKQNKKDMIQE